MISRNSPSSPISSASRPRPNAASPRSVMKSASSASGATETSSSRQGRAWASVRPSSRRRPIRRASRGDQDDMDECHQQGQDEYGKGECHAGAVQLRGQHRGYECCGQDRGGQVEGDGQGWRGDCGSRAGGGSRPRTRCRGRPVRADATAASPARRLRPQIRTQPAGSRRGLQ